MDAERGIHRADGLTGLGRIDAQSFTLDDFGCGSV
jgi:hypothetical protein